MQLRAKTLRLERELCDAKKDSQQMVAALQQNMSEKVTDLRDELTSAQLQCQRMMSWAVRVMGSRHTSILLREAWAAWRELTWHRDAFQTREHKMQQLAVRFVRLRFHRAFNAWWEGVNIMKHARQQAEKACRRIMDQQIAACFATWKQSVGVGARARETLALAVRRMQTRPLRAVMRKWAACVQDTRSRVHVCEWMAARAKRRLVASMFWLWQQLLLDARVASGHMSWRLQRKRLAACFSAWYAATGTGGTTRLRTVRHEHFLAARICKRICKSALRDWRRNAARKARNREIIVRRYDVLAWRLQSSVLLGWRTTVLRRRRGRRIVERCSIQRRHRCMRAVLDAWCGAKADSHTPLERLEQTLFRRCGAISDSVHHDLHRSIDTITPAING